MELRKNQVDVWYFDQDISAEIQQYYYSILSDAEKTRVQAYYFDKDAKQYIAAKARLRLLLAGYLNKKPEAIVFDYLEFKKPVIRFYPTLKFNVSHSYGKALIAINRHFNLGVDIEWFPREVEHDELASRFFSRKEADEFLKLPESDKPRAFFNCWTRKEAFIKAVGEGLSFPLDAFEVSLAINQPARLLSTHWDKKEKNLWHLRDFDFGNGYIGALAVKGAVQEVNVRDFERVILW